MIDWKFIAQLEGERLVGYVPDPVTSQSGVTIAAGVDLGQLTSTELALLPATLQTKLLPYLGLRQAAAERALALHPLSITTDEAQRLDAVARAADLAPLKIQYHHYAGEDFDALPDAVQTVAASVSFQYGAIWKRCPKFWVALTSQNVPLMIAELRDFGDQYETRRHREAVYLEGHLAQPGPG